MSAPMMVDADFTEVLDASKAMVFYTIETGLAHVVLNAMPTLLMLVDMDVLLTSGASYHVPSNPSTEAKSAMADLRSYTLQAIIDRRAQAPLASIR